MHHLAAFDALGAQNMPGRLHIVGAGHKVNQPWALCHGFLQAHIVHVKPTRYLRSFRDHRLGIDRDDFKISHREFRGGYFEQPVVGPVFFMFAARGWRDAQGFFAPLHTCFERCGHHHEVINLSFHVL